MLQRTNITSPDTHHNSELSLIMNSDQPNHPLITTNSDGNPCFASTSSNHHNQQHVSILYLSGDNIKPAAAISPGGLISSIISGNYSPPHFNEINNTEFDLHPHHHLKLPLLENEPEQQQFENNDSSVTKLSRGICRNLEKSMASIECNNINNNSYSHHQIIDNGVPAGSVAVIKEEKEAEAGVRHYNYSSSAAEEQVELMVNENDEDGDDMKLGINPKIRKHDDADDDGEVKINDEDAVAVNKKLRPCNGCEYRDGDESCAGVVGKVTSSGTRITHITVERNRRKQMNEHLAILRSLMPTSYVQRADQASIIGGVVEFINELKQLLTSLEAQKRRRTYVIDALKRNTMGIEGQPSPSVNQKININDQNGTCHDNLSMMMPWAENNLELVRATSRSRVAEVEVRLVGGTHVLLRVLAPRHQPQLIHLLPTLECLSLNVLHLNITTLYQHNSILYTFTLQIGIDCRLSVDELANVVQQTFIDIHS